MAKHEKGRDKPMGVVLLTILSFALGVLMVIGGVSLLVLDLDAIEGVIPIIASLEIAVRVIILLVFAALFLTIGIGLWSLKGWAKSILLVITILDIVIFPAILAFSLANIGGEISTLEITGMLLKVFGIVLSLVILLYILRVKVILAFEAREMTFIKKRILVLKERVELAREECNAGEIKKAELSQLRSDCVVEERVLRGKLRHLEKLRLSRERKLKDKAEKKKEAKVEKKEEKEEKREEKEEKKAQKEEKKAKKEEEKTEAEQKKEAKEGKEKEETEEGEEKGESEEEEGNEKQE